jgi:hypothetical protein
MGDRRGSHEHSVNILAGNAGVGAPKFPLPAPHICKRGQVRHAIGRLGWVTRRPSPEVSATKAFVDVGGWSFAHGFVVHT